MGSERLVFRVSWQQQHNRRHSGNAFAATGEAEAFGGGGLDANSRRVEPHNLGDTGFYCLAMRADLGCFTQQSDVGVSDASAAIVNPADGVFQKDV